MIKIAIIGGTGYTASELLRLLAQHPSACVKYVSSRSEQGKSLASVHSNLRGVYDLCFCNPEDIDYTQVDLAFFATPHGVAQASMQQVLTMGVRVVDLSADFRIRDQATWEQWYQQSHACPELIQKAVYGLPEQNRKDIADADLIACPGCYPTSVQLGLKPLLDFWRTSAKRILNEKTIVANCASGATGAGKQAKIGNIYSEVADSYMAYAVSGHRHLPEIEQGLGDIAQAEVNVTFVPHLLPVNRGILATIYVDLVESNGLDIQQLYNDAYKEEPFVDVLPSGEQPTLRSVRGSNICRIGIERPQGRNKLVITVVEDNLTKGASGQAVQCMNIMFGLDETSGLDNLPLLP